MQHHWHGGGMQHQSCMGPEMWSGVVPWPPAPPRRPAPLAPTAIVARDSKSHYSTVIVWNLKSSYSVTELADDLYEIDFLPEELEAISSDDEYTLAACKGAFILHYKHDWLANAIVLSLDDNTQGHLKSDEGPIRVTSWHKGAAKAAAEDFPSIIKKALIEQQKTWAI